MKEMKMGRIAEAIAAAVIMVFCTPFGWVGLIIFGIVLQGLK